LEKSNKSTKRWKVAENMENKFSDMFYIEWKYFSFIQKDINAVFSYSIGDPTNRSKRGEGLTFVRIYLENESVGETIKIPLEKSKVSDIDSTASFGDLGIEQKDENTIRIYGKTEKIVWELTYFSKSPTYSDVKDVKSWLIRKSFYEWNVHMPTASVKGRITLPLQKKTFDIDTKGYHDGNLGKIIPWKPQWNWFQMTNEDKKRLCIVMGDVVNMPQGGVFLFWGDDKIFFKINEFEYHPKNQNRKTLKRLGGKSELLAENDKYKLSLKLKELRSDKLKVKMPFILPNIVINEAMAEIEGTFSKKEGDSLIPLETIKCLGFKEYTNREWFWTKK
jgi:hypothetical protein